MAEAAPQPRVIARRRIERAVDEEPSVPTSLFREEALQRRLHITRERPLAVFPSAWGWFSALLFAAFVTIVAFLLIGSFSRRETVAGILRPESGEVRFTASREGVIVELFVRDGQQVTADQPLYSVRTETRALSGDAVTARNLETLEVQQQATVGRWRAEAAEVAAEQRAAEVRLASQRSVLNGLAAQQRLAAERVRIAQSSLDRAQTLYSQGLMTATELSRREETLVNARAQVLQADQDVLRTREEIGRASTDIARLQARLGSLSQQGRLADASLTERQVMIDAESGYLVRAPRAGVVSGLRLAAGARVAAGEEILAITPVGVPLVAELAVPSTAIGFVRAGDRVRLMYDAFPYERFGAIDGRIISVSTSPSETPPGAQLVDAPPRAFIVRVALPSQSLFYGDRQYPLRAGSTLRADLILEERTLFEWLFDPIKGAQQRVS